MIVWLASYPRSGNTFLRIVLDRVYGAHSSVVYDTDGVAERLGREFVGFKERADVEAARRDEAIHFIKTHRQRDERVHHEDRVICLVRDGRDALVSYARMLSEGEPEAFEERLRVCGADGERRRLLPEGRDRRVAGGDAAGAA
jgi:hypothetical protein